MLDMGILLPKMGTLLHEQGDASTATLKASHAYHHSLADALFSSTQQQVFGLLFGQSSRQFSITELIALAQVGSGAVQREMKRLVQSGLVSVHLMHGRKLYQANPQSPVFEELRSIIEKTIGVPEQIRQALESISNDIQFAILYGSVAKGCDTASSDIDILIVSDNVMLEEIFSVLEAAERRIGRPISPVLYTSQEFRERKQASQPFLTKVLAGKHTVLFGSEDAIATVS